MKTFYYSEIIADGIDTEIVLAEYFNGEDSSLRAINENLEAEQGKNVVATHYEITIDTLAYKAETGGEFDFDELVKEYHPSDLHMEDWAEAWTKEYTPHYPSIDGKVIVSYVHVQFMNYAHRVTNVRIGQEGETTQDLSENPDNTNRVWDKVIDADSAGQVMDELNLKLTNPGATWEMIELALSSKG